MTYPPARPRLRPRWSWVLTLSWTEGRKPVVMARTFRGTFVPVAGDTRTSLLTGIYDDTVKNHIPSGALTSTPVILFWTLDPEDLV